MNDHDKLLRRGLLLEYVTLGWNVVGTGIATVAAIRAHSVALAGFGLDSLIEIGASVVVIWQLRNLHDPWRERRALRLIAAAFFALAVYVLVQSARALIVQAHPDASALGEAWLALTLVAMLALAGGKHATGVRLANPVLTAEARVTLVDAYLAGAVLVGLLLDTLAGWWWADPMAGLVIVFYGTVEGRHAWKEAGASTSAAPRRD